MRLVIKLHTKVCDGNHPFTMLCSIVVARCTRNNGMWKGNNVKKRCETTVLPGLDFGQNPVYVIQNSIYVNLGK